MPKPDAAEYGEYAVVSHGATESPENRAAYELYCRQGLDTYERRRGVHLDRDTFQMVYVADFKTIDAATGQGIIASSFGWKALGAPRA